MILDAIKIIRLEVLVLKFEVIVLCLEVIVFAITPSDCFLANPRSVKKSLPLSDLQPTWTMVKSAPSILTPLLSIGAHIYPRFSIDPRFSRISWYEMLRFFGPVDQDKIIENLCSGWEMENATDCPLSSKFWFKLNKFVFSFSVRSSA